MPGNARDGNPTAVKLNPSSSKSSSELEEMRQLFKSNRESLREFENSPDLRRPRVHFAVADTSGLSDGGNIEWSHLKLLHSTSQRVQSSQSPPELQPTPLRSRRHVVEYDSPKTLSHFDHLPLTPTGTDAHRKYQRMLAVVEERMISIREKEAHLQLQRHELADKEFIFESERSASVLMRHKYLSAEAMMSEAHNLQNDRPSNQIKAERAVAIATASNLESEKKVVELQQKLKDFATELDCEKTKNDELQREHEQQSIHLHVKTDRLENEIASLQQQLLAQKKNSELHIQLLQSQVQDKGATVLHLEEALIDTRQQVLLLQQQIQNLKEQNAFSSSQIDAERTEIERRKESLASSEVALDAAQHQLRNAHLEIEATAAMLLSDCSARQHAATEEVEKAKVQLQELQEQIRKHQIQLQSLHREIAEFTHQYADLQAAASHFRDLRLKQQQECIELQSTRVQTEEHIRKQQHQLQSLRHETAELRAHFAHLQSEASHFHDMRQQHQQEEFEFRNVHREMEAAASMLLSDCSARQYAATEEVEKAKIQLQELQEQIRKHQIQLQSLQNDVGDTLSVQLAHLKNRVESPYPVVNVTAAAAFLDPNLVTPRTPQRGDGDLYLLAASPAMTPNTFGKAMSTRW